MTDLKGPHQALAAALVMAVVADTESKAAESVELANKISSMLDDDAVKQIQDVVEICLSMLGPGEDSVVN
tara:strand:+ start:2588 stop:2797 length:210 start_codon:yes stop_codon:yes gene_type:complete